MELKHNRVPRIPEVLNSTGDCRPVTDGLAIAGKDGKSLSINYA